MMVTRSTLVAVLDGLERLEDPLLSWGVVGATLSDDDVDRVIDRQLEADGSPDDPLDVLDALKDEGLLVRAEGGYRTRIGELLWELANLRQLFPPRDEPDGPPRSWRRSAKLVDGFRYTRRPREYPRRDRDPDRLAEQLTQSGTIERDVLKALTSTPDGRRFQLSGFQERATETILAQASGARSSGTIVGAGTGSGKTLAFYLPAFMHMARRIEHTSGLRTLALYPRNELLKDQLQSAVTQAAALAPLLERRAGRPLRVGALFGDVPETVRMLERPWHRSWRRRGPRRVCPYLLCPGIQGAGCGGDLTVSTQDRSNDPSLRCDTCGLDLGADLFVLTRDQLRRRPPDLLFASTEMLNRIMLDPSSAQLLGLDTAAGPDLVLLDEVHTYGGTSGAMTALTLRRWRNRVRTDPGFVGLSATLLDAPRFFADLTGLHADQVIDIRPDPDELVPEGAEYHLVLRGDPTSGAGLLSTTIQTSMLLGRTMDPGARDRTAALYGTKVFVFTDDLDVTNRLFFDLLDAEGQRYRRNGNLVYKPSLAYLRATVHDDVLARRRAGQVWDLATATGHDLTPDGRLRIGRTSSQDAGLDSDAQLIVATSSLEVGVDDPSVGGILQHKAPRDAASFLQRQGRAGRQRGTRPLTTVVLSDYGRDRETFEAWDQLLSPLLRPSALPIRNAHVLRMQAALATLSWAGQQAGPIVAGVNLWSALSRPASSNSQRVAQQAIADILRQLLTDDKLRERLARHLQDALNIEPTIVEGLLWQPPRSLLLGAVPSLLRRIHDDWAVTDDKGYDTRLREDADARQPLPEFVPPTLFSPLALPEVLVELPPPTGGDPARPPIEPVPLVQALKELAPGRITKRFAITADLDRAWVPVDPTAGSVDIADFVDLYQRDGEVNHTPLLRPLRLRTSTPPKELADSTNGRPQWTSEVRPRGPGSPITLSDVDPLTAVIRHADAFLHRDQRQVQVLRGVAATEVSVLRRGGEQEQAVLRLVHDGAPALLGGAFDVDALRLTVRIEPPRELWTGPLAAELRSSWFRHRLVDALQPTLDRFLAGWVHDIVTTALLTESVSSQRPLSSTWQHLSGNLRQRLDATLAVVLAVSDLDGADDATTTSKLRGRLDEALAAPEVERLLQQFVPTLWEDPDADADRWVRRRLLRTVGEVVLKGAAALCPDHDPDIVVLDLETGEDGDDAIWLSEQLVGGGGFLEAVVDSCIADPARLLRLARASLQPSAAEIVPNALARAAEAAVHNSSVAAAFTGYRQAEGASQRSAALQQLRGTLRAIGIPMTPDVLGSIVNRLLRAGSNNELDRLIERSVRRWADTETELGVEIPVRTWSYLESAVGDHLDEEQLNRLQTVLWPRGSIVSNRRFASYRPFGDEPDPMPRALETVLAASAAPKLDVREADQAWEQISDLLRHEGVARLAADPEHKDVALQVIARTATEPVMLDHLRVLPEVTTLDLTSDGGLQATIELPLLGRWRRSALPDANARPRTGTRRLLTSGRGRSNDIDRLHHLLFVMELIEPSRPFYLVSAWLSNVAVIDNRGGELFSIAPGLPARRLGLVEVLTELTARGGDARVVVREHEHNRPMIAQLQQVGRRTTAGSLQVSVRPELHDKVLVGERISIEGSMNLTHRGAERNEEGVRIVTDPADLAAQRSELARRFGGTR